MLEVSYEALVADPQTISRALVAFCGLEWEESCLRFWESERFVNTASYDQVRRPVYDSSVGAHPPLCCAPRAFTRRPGRWGKSMKLQAAPPSWLIR